MSRSRRKYVTINCPICGNQGRVEKSRPGIVCVTECDDCGLWILYYCGGYFALDDQVMRTGSHEQKIEAMKSALMDFFHAQLDDLVLRLENRGAFGSMANRSKSSNHNFATIRRSPITAQEQRAFCSVDLKMIDDARYFKAVFGKPGDD